MRNLKILLRIAMLLVFISINVSAVTLDTDDFSSGDENWSNGSVVSSKYKIGSGITASKTFLYPAYANEPITLTLTADQTGYDSGESYIITMNGVQVTSSNSDATLTFNGYLNASGELIVTVKSNSNSSSESVTIDNVSLVTGASNTIDNFRDFTLVNTYNINGNMQIIGNSVMLDSGGLCPGTTTNNNDLNPVWADKDTNTSTWNSTSANLNLPVGVDSTKIKYAGLYWQGRVDSGEAFSSGNTILFKPEGITSYQSVTSLNRKFNWSIRSQDKSYQGIADVTSLVKQSIDTVSSATIASTGFSGTFWAANILAKEMSNGFGAWSLVIVYEDSTDTLKNISVYDGYKEVTGNTAVPITLSGFLTPNTTPVNSKFLIFGGEGDISLNDSTTLTNNVGTDISLGSNVFNSSETNSSGSNITTRNPSCQNTIGIDIHTFDIGTNGSPSIIGTGQTTTTIKLKGAANDSDTYYPGVFAFSTDIYQPQICYIEDIFKGTTNISGIGTKVNEDDTLTVRVYIKNTGNEAASGVQIRHQFDTSFPYSVNSADYNNSNPPYETLMPPSYSRTIASDSSGNDLYEYNTTSLISKINLGTGATVSSGGTFNTVSSGSPTYAVFEYNATVKALDNNYSNTYQAGYINSVLGLDYTNNPVTIYSCDGSKNSFWGYRPIQTVIGDFNVVYADHANGALSSGYYYNLPTQITSRADNYKVISLAPSTNTLKDVNATVAVELVNADSSGNCSSMTPISNRVWVLFDDDNVTDFSGDVIAKYYDSNKTAATSTKDNEFYQKAGKNVVFRTSWNTNASGNMIPLTKLGSGQYKLSWFPNYAQGQQCGAGFVAPNGGSNQITTWCANNGQGNGENGMTPSELYTCMECIFGIYTQKVCSRDNFAIRPEGFFVKLNDQNQTNSATKQFMMNNAPSPANQNMASGYRYYMEVNATNHLDTNSSFDYNTTENVDFVWNSTQTGCNDDTNKSIAFNFVNGLADGNVSVDQVGEYRLSIIDTAWTAVDSNTSLMTHHTSPYFMLGVDTDCIANSSSTSAVGSGTLNGCNISTNHTNSVAGVTYTDSDVTFHPYKFDMTTINFGVGTQPQEINATSGPDFVYMSDMSRTDSMNMSVRATGTISARGENNATLSNFVDNCYAVNTNLSMNTYNNITLANTDYQVRFVDSNGSGTVYDSNATNVVTSALSIPLMTLNDGNFTKDMSGSLNTVTRLNYDRNQTTPLNPMTVQYGTLGFKCVTASECTMQADLSGSHEALGSRAMDFNVTHIYGRIIPRDVRVFGNVPFVANAWYEGYNIPILNGASLEASKIDAMWYANSVHTDANDGDGNVTVIIPTSPLALPTHSSSTMGMETYQFSAIPLANIPYGGKAHINTDPWLWYGINALNYADPVNSTNLDCLTHPCFNITVVPSIGATGSAKSTNEATKASKKTDSGGGTWKSTSDYAPAIR